MVCGEPAEVLDAFLAEPAVELVSFTGGVAIGKAIADRLGYRRAVLELGGNDPLIVLADADLEEAAALAVSGAFQQLRAALYGRQADHRRGCHRRRACGRVVGRRSRRSRSATRSIASTDIGTVIDERAAIAIEERVRDAIADGAQLLYGGQREGAQLTPAVLDHVSPESRLVATETFGPVAPIIRVTDLDAAIAVANATPYALSSGVCTFDWRAISRCVKELRAGTVNIREVPGWRTELTPFGGIGDSGLGVKEGVREAIKAMTFTKLYTLPWG